MNKKAISGIVIFIALLAGVYFFWASKPLVVVNTPLAQEDETALTANAISSAVSSITSPMQPRKVMVNKVVKTTKVVVDTKNALTVTYTEDGFEPNELKVPRGTSVKFVNKTNASMRIFAKQDAKPPFSDINQPKTLGLNGEYIFNFTYSGTWEYYNLFKPEDVGIIVVY